MRSYLRFFLLFSLSSLSSLSYTLNAVAIVIAAFFMILLVMAPIPFRFCCNMYLCTWLVYIYMHRAHGIHFAEMTNFNLYLAYQTQHPSKCCRKKV